jgi:hypothetical protein
LFSAKAFKKSRYNLLIGLFLLELTIRNQDSFASLSSDDFSDLIFSAK